MTGKTLRLSWSQMRNHEECKQKSYLLRTGKKPKTTNIRSYFHGMVVDRIMRDWLDDPHRSPGAMADMVAASLKTVEQEAKETGDGIVRWKDAQDRRDVAVFCVELCRKLEPILNALVLPYRHQSATRFSVPLRIPDLNNEITEILLVGETDLVVHHPAGLQVWDLKGTKDGQYWRKVLGQLYFYDIAMLALHGKRTERVGLIQPMCDVQIMEWTVSDQDRATMFSRIVGMAHDIWREERTCKETTAGCSWCDVRHACPRFALDDEAWNLPDALRAAAGGTP